MMTGIGTPISQRRMPLPMIVLHGPTGAALGSDNPQTRRLFLLEAGRRHRAEVHAGVHQQYFARVSWASVS
jgi:hypothetical protein